MAQQFRAVRCLWPRQRLDRTPLEVRGAISTQTALNSSWCKLHLERGIRISRFLGARRSWISISGFKSLGRTQFNQALPRKWPVRKHFFSESKKLGLAHKGSKRAAHSRHRCTPVPGSAPRCCHILSAAPLPCGEILSGKRPLVSLEFMEGKGTEKTRHRWRVRLVR